MMQLLHSVLCITALIIIGTSCYDEITVGDLSPETAAELKLIFQENSTVTKPKCGEHPTPNSADFLLYKRDNPNYAIFLRGTSLEQINPQKDIIILIHGWLTNSSSFGITKLKNAYLRHYDCNVILVDWSKQAYQPYSKAYCNTPGIARALSQFLCSVKKQLGIDLNAMQLVGHTVGAHIAGLAGQYTFARCGKRKIGRITGLNPSGPIFRTVNDEKKLSKWDAINVDAIHTDEGGIGTSERCGMQDFYPFHGTTQPGCPFIDEIRNNTLVSHVLCSSLRSIQYFIASLNYTPQEGTSKKGRFPRSTCTRACATDIRKLDMLIPRIAQPLILPVCESTTCQ